MLFTRDRIRRLRAIGRRDALMTRLLAERAIDSAGLRPAGLPASAIVCVRRIRVAAARRAAGDLRPWMPDARAQVADALRMGARPLASPPPANAAAIVFMDEAELLASLVHDYARGHGDAWWWRALLGSPPTDALLRDLLIEAAPIVPAAVDLLERRGGAPDLGAALPPPACGRAIEAVAVAFGVARPQAGRGPDHDCGPAQSIAATPEPGAIREALRAARLRDVDRLEPVQRALIGAALLLHRAPALARAPGVFAAVLRTLERSAGPPIEPGVSGFLDSRGSRGGPARAVEPLVPSPPGHGRSRARDERDADTRATDRNEATPSPTPSGDRLPARVQAEDARALDVRTAVHAAAVRDAGTDRNHEAVEPVAIETVASACAGVLYLVNVAIRGGLYADFTEPASTGALDIPMGDFLALAGERICGAALRDDKAWGILSTLSGRSTEEPRGVLDDGTFEALRRTAAFALDMAPDDALGLLCCRPGRIVLTPTRLDAFFALETHPLSIRMGGLDRNPGWVPAAGRFMEFVYE